MPQLLFSCQQKKLAPIGHRTENLWPFYVTALVFVVTHWEARKISLECGGKTPMGQILFVRDQTTRKCQRSYSVHPVGVRSDEGDATAEAESIPLGCSGIGNLFVFLCSFIGRSNQINSVLMAQFLSFSCQQKKTCPNRASDEKFMAILCDCYCLHVLHTGRLEKFCWNADRKPLCARS